jgi:hypothetical protein
MAKDDFVVVNALRPEDIYSIAKLPWQTQVHLQCSLFMIHRLTTSTVFAEGSLAPSKIKGPNCLLFQRL